MEKGGLSRAAARTGILRNRKQSINKKNGIVGVHRKQ